MIINNELLGFMVVDTNKTIQPHQIPYIYTAETGGEYEWTDETSHRTTFNLETKELVCKIWAFDEDECDWTYCELMSDEELLSHLKNRNFLLINNVVAG